MDEHLIGGQFEVPGPGGHLAGLPGEDLDLVRRIAVHQHGARGEPDLRVGGDIFPRRYLPHRIDHPAGERLPAHGAGLPGDAFPAREHERYLEAF